MTCEIFFSLLYKLHSMIIRQETVEKMILGLVLI